MKYIKTKLVLDRVEIKSLKHMTKWEQMTLCSLRRYLCVFPYDISYFAIFVYKMFTSMIVIITFQTSYTQL